MAVTLVNSNIATHASNQPSQTRSFTVSAGADLLIVAACNFDAGNAAFSTVTFNGDSLTPQGAGTTAGTGRVRHYFMVAPDIATGNIIVTCDAAADVLWSGAHSWSGVDQTTPLADGTTGTSGCTVVNCTSDDVCLGLGADNYVSTTTGFTPSHTQIWESNKPGTGQICSAQYRTGTGSLALSWTTSTLCIGHRIVAASAVASAALDGSLSSGAEASDIVGGGNTITLTLTNDTWVPDDGTFAAIRDEIIAGMDSNQAEAAGWDAVVKVGGLSVTDVVRTSPTLVTITFPAIASYSITLTELITVTIPAVALTGGIAVVASPTFTIVTGEATSGGRGAVNSGLLNRGLVGSGLVGA